MSLDQRLTRAAHEVADRVVVPEVDLDSVRSRARTRRRATVAAAGAAAVTAVVLAGVVLVGAPDAEEPAPVDPNPSQILGPRGPVWWDAAGLHHGRRVEPTPVDLIGPTAVRDGANDGVLALVRTGALYRDPATDDVWFHPWDGKPRIVGQGSATGPGGDPHGDLAAWFEGEELVVYDTAAGRQVSRTTKVPVDDAFVSEHVAGGNGFMHVSTEEVVWRTEAETGHDTVHRFDLATGISSLLFEEQTGVEYPDLLLDVHDDTRVWGKFTPAALVVQHDGGETAAPPGVEPGGRLNTDGSLLLSPTELDGSHGAAVVDVRSGEMWPLPGRKSYAWISWSYRDLAVIDVQRDGRDVLLACDAATRECAGLPREGTVVLPTS